MERLRWISATLFLEFLALSQCLPGPTSTQVSFALGVVSKGVSGGLISGAPAAMRLADAAYAVLQSAQCLGCSAAENRNFSREKAIFWARSALLDVLTSSGEHLDQALSPAGTLFQYPGFLIASLVGAGAASFLRNPAPWLHGLLSGMQAKLRLVYDPAQPVPCPAVSM